MVVANHLLNPLFSAEEWVRWFSLGRRVQPSAQCRIGLWPDALGRARSRQNTWAGGLRAERPRLPPAARTHDHIGPGVTESDELFRSLQPPVMSRALRYSLLRGLRG
jgi:hypothetical protein